MAFATFDRRAGAQPMSDINMVPLIDVMLVLLVIFIVTAPLLTHAVKLDLPHVTSQPDRAPSERIEFAIAADGTRHWNGQVVSRDEAARRFRLESGRQPQPEIHLRADQRTAYRHVAETLADAAGAGLGKVGFVSEPEAR